VLYRGTFFNKHEEGITPAEAHNYVYFGVVVIIINGMFVWFLCFLLYQDASSCQRRITGSSGNERKADPHIKYSYGIHMKI